jgi:ribonuclease Z
MGPSILVEVEDHKLLFDCGRGASIGLREYGLRLGEVTGVFLTHLHPDHIVGLPDLWLSSYHRAGFGGRTGKIPVFGPVGTRNMTDRLEEAYIDVVKQWGIEHFNPGFNTLEFSDEDVVFCDGDLAVSAFKVMHSPGSGLDPYGFKIVYSESTVIISGDTGYSENLCRNAAGADLLVLELFVPSPGMIEDKSLFERLKVSHTVPEIAIRILNEANPKETVFIHLDPSLPSKDKVRSLIEDGYSGVFHIGEDLMTFKIQCYSE